MKQGLLGRVQLRGEGPVEKCHARNENPVWVERRIIGADYQTADRKKELEHDELPCHEDISRRDDGSRSSHAVAFGIPIRRSQRKCDARPAQKEECSVYLTPNSWQVSLTSFDIAG